MPPACPAAGVLGPAMSALNSLVVLRAAQRRLTASPVRSFCKPGRCIGQEQDKGGLVAVRQVTSDFELKPQILKEATGCFRNTGPSASGCRPHDTLGICLTESFLNRHHFPTGHALVQRLLGIRATAILAS